MHILYLLSGHHSAARLATLVAGRLGDWETGRLGDWETRRQGEENASTLVSQSPSLPVSQSVFTVFQSPSLTVSPSPNSRNRLLDIEAWRGLRRLLRNDRPAVIHVFELPALRALGLATLFYGKLPPIVLSLSPARIRHNRLNWWERRLLQKVAVITVFTEAERTALISLGLSATRVRAIPPGVPLPESIPNRKTLLESLGIPPDGRVILCTGQIEPGRFFYSYWAFDIIRYTDPHLYWVLVGGGPGRAKLEQRIAATAGKDKRFCFAGPRDDAAIWPQLAEVVWIPHTDAGGTFTLLEGMAAGRPVVSTALPSFTSLDPRWGNGSTRTTRGPRRPGRGDPPALAGR